MEKLVPEPTIGEQLRAFAEQVRGINRRLAEVRSGLPPVYRAEAGRQVPLAQDRLDDAWRGVSSAADFAACAESEKGGPDGL